MNDATASMQPDAGDPAREAAGDSGTGRAHPPGATRDEGPLGGDEARPAHRPDAPASPVGRAAADGGGGQAAAHDAADPAADPADGPGRHAERDVAEATEPDARAADAAGAGPAGAGPAGAGPAGAGPASAARAVVATGHPDVDRAVRRLDALDDADLAQQLEVYDDIQRALAAVLDERAPGEGAGTDVP